MEIVSSDHSTQLKIVRPRLKFCVYCSEQLKFKYSYYRKTVYYLEKTVRVIGYAYHCIVKDCPLFEKTILGPNPAPKYHGISYEVMTYIALQRLQSKQTFAMIQQQLRVTYGLKISTKQISNIFDKYLQLVGTKPAASTLEELRAGGKVILSIDGIKPKKGDKILYLITDMLSGAMLLARTLSYNSTFALAALFKEIKSMDLPVVGIVSDKQRSIVKAISQEFEDISHQYCQFHFLTNIGKPFEEADLALRKQLRKQIKPITNTIKTVKRQYQAGKLSDRRYRILSDLYYQLRLSSVKSAKYPFEPVGIVFWKELFEFEKTIKAMQKQLPVIVFKTILKHLTRIKTMYGDVYRKLHEQFYQLCRIEDLLDVTVVTASKKKSISFGKSLLRYVETQLKRSLRVKASKEEKSLHDWWKIVLKMTKSWLPGLFTFCEMPLLPRTNNQLEQLIHSVKSDFKFLRGEKFIHRFLLRRGEFWVFARENSNKSIDELVLQLTETAGVVKIEEKERFEDLATHFQVMRRSRGNFRGEMKSLRLAWAACC